MCDIFNSRVKFLIFDEFLFIKFLTRKKKKKHVFMYFKYSVALNGPSNIAYFIGNI